MLCSCVSLSLRTSTLRLVAPKLPAVITMHVLLSYPSVNDLILLTDPDGAEYPDVRAQVLGHGLGVAPHVCRLADIEHMQDRMADVVGILEVNRGHRFNATH
jgi:hypothetical protein